MFSQVLACLTSRAFYIEEKPEGDALLTAAFQLRWEGRRGYKTLPLRGNASGTLSRIDLRGMGNARAHSRLACEADVSSQNRLLLISDNYFLKVLRPRHNPSTS